MPFDTRCIAAAPDVIAPDGSEVRLLCGVGRGGMAVFTLPPGAISRAIRHRTVEEVWYILSGTGRIWRRLGAQEEVTELTPGLSLTIPAGTCFQFRCDGEVPLSALGVTMPPWPGAAEAEFVGGTWPTAADTSCGA